MHDVFNSIEYFQTVIHIYDCVYCLLVLNNNCNTSSGFLILRNTPWVRNFNKKWWTIADRHEKCDQDAFDMLYREVFGI